MGNFRIEIEAVGGHGCDRNAKQGEAIAVDPLHANCPDCIARRFVSELKSGMNVVEAKLVHWPDSTPIVDDIANGVRLHRDFSSAWHDEPLLQFFSYAHLQSEAMKACSKQFALLAYQLVASLPRNPERTVALRKLLEAKDCAVRALIMKPVETRPGSH